VAIALHLLLYSALYAALQMNSSVKNQITLENTGEKHDKAIHIMLSQIDTLRCQ